MHMGECMYMSHCMCVEGRGPLWELVLSLLHVGSRAELRLSDLMTSTFIHRAISSKGRKNSFVSFFFFQCGYINANLVIVPGSYFMGLVIVILAQTRVTWEEVASVEFLPSDWLVSSHSNEVGGSSPL